MDRTLPVSSHTTIQSSEAGLPAVPVGPGERAYTIQKSPAALLLARRVPDVLAEIPLRPITVDYRAEEPLALHEECLMPGWHFFYKGVSTQLVGGRSGDGRDFTRNVLYLSDYILMRSVITTNFILYFIYSLPYLHRTLRHVKDLQYNKARQVSES